MTKTPKLHVISKKEDNEKSSKSKYTIIREGDKKELYLKVYPEKGGSWLYTFEYYYAEPLQDREVDALATSTALSVLGGLNTKKGIPIMRDNEMHYIHYRKTQDLRLICFSPYIPIPISRLLSNFIPRTYLIRNKKILLHKAISSFKKSVELHLRNEYLRAKEEEELEEFVRCQK